MDLEYLKIPTEKTLELMIIEEEKIRQSSEYQNKCSEVKNTPNGWLNVTANMQEELVKKYGFDDQISCDIACNMLRTARFIFPNNDIFWQVPVYVRNNKANNGIFNVNDIIPNLKIHNICGQEIELHQLLNQDKPNLILASSHT